MPKLHRLLWMPTLLLAFITMSFIYLALKGGIPPTKESYFMIAGSYLITALLFALRLMRIRRDRQREAELKKELEQATKKNA